MQNIYAYYVLSIHKRDSFHFLQFEKFTIYKFDLMDFCSSYSILVFKYHFKSWLLVFHTLDTWG